MTDDLLNDLGVVFSSIGGIGFFAAWWYMIATWLGGTGALWGWLTNLPFPTPF
jgi:hypothetical protein